MRKELLQPDGVCCTAPGHCQIGGELCEPGQRPPGEAFGLPGRDDRREQRQPHELHCEPAGTWVWWSLPTVHITLETQLALSLTIAFDRYASLFTTAERKHVQLGSFETE